MTTGGGSRDDAGEIDEVIALGHQALTLTRDPRARYPILKHIAQAYFDRSRLFRGDLQSSAEAVHFATLAISTLPNHDPRLGKACSALWEYVENLLSSGADRRELPEVVRVCQAAIRRVRPDSPEAALYAFSYASLLHLLASRIDVDLLDERIAACELCARTTPAGDPFLYTIYYAIGTLAFERYQRRRDPRDLDLTIAACRRSVTLAAAPDTPPRRGVGDLVALGYALRLRLDIQTGRGTSAGSSDLDEAIAAFRLLMRERDTQQERDRAIEQLCGLLVRRFRADGNRADLDEVIKIHHRAKQTWQGHHTQVPGAAAAEEALRLRAVIDNSSVDSVLAFAMNHFRSMEHKQQTERPWGAFKSFNEPYTVLASRRRGHTHPDHQRAAEITEQVAWLRTRSGLAQRMDLLDDLVDALQARTITTPSAQALDELIDGTELLIRAIPEDDVFHRSVHLVGLGVALCERSTSGGRSDDARKAFLYLENASAVESLPTDLRIMAARAAGEMAAAASDWLAAAGVLRLAVSLLPRLVPQHLSPSDHIRQLAPMFGLVSDAAAAAIRAGDPTAALELLEQGRGPLIGRAVDARDGLSEELRRIADELAQSSDPHAAQEPGQPSVVDHRRELARAWDREVARIRSLEGFEDYLVPPRLADLSPIAIAGPVVTVVVSRFGADALMLTTQGVEVVPLPELTVEGLYELVETFFGALPFAELSPGDETVSVMAQEPLRAVLARLWDTVARPVLDRLRGTERVWWVPTGLLAALPLHAAGRDGDSVLDRVISSYTPTIKVLGASRSQASERLDTAGLIAVADIPDLPPLPGTTAEAFDVMQRFPAATRLAGSAATPDAVLTAIDKSGWLHVACHASTFVDNPAASALHLHGGKVTASEVMAMKAPGGRLAYLSACSTVLIGTRLADEVIHLGSAFQIAGFPHVVGTLWRVTDGTAAETTRLFYGEVGITETQAPLALHRTAKRLRERYPLLPTRWAPYVHLGG